MDTLIDDEGRLLGKINIIDLMVAIIFLMIFMAVVNFFHEENTKNIMKNTNSTTNIENSFNNKLKIKIQTFAKEDWFINAIKIGDEEIVDNKTIAVLKNISIETAKNKGDPELKEIVLDFELSAEEKNGKYNYLKNQEIKIGRQLNVNLKTIDVGGIVISLEKAD